MAIIKVPARSIVGKPKLNISNDNKFGNIGYEKSVVSENYIDILTFNIQYAQQSSVSQNFDVNDNRYEVYPNLMSYYSKDIVSSNQDVEIVGEYPSINLTTGYSRDNYLLLKITVKKNDSSIDYYTPNFMYKYNLNIDEGVVDTSVALYTLFCLSNKSFAQPHGISEFSIFSSEEELLNSVLVDSKYINFDVFKDCAIVEENNYVHYYFPMESFLYKDDQELQILKINLNSDLTLSLKKVSKNNAKVNEGAKYSLADNELLSTETTVGDKTIYEVIEQSIVSEYSKGKFSVDLSCLYMEYKDTNGNIVYTGSDGQMVKVGDLIEPYYFNSELGDLPVATYPDGTPMAFKVYRAEISTTDAKYITNDISALEVDKPKEFTLNITSNDSSRTYSVELNGNAVSGSVSAYSGDILHISKENLNIWKTVTVNGVDYDLESQYVGIGFDGYTFEISQDTEVYFYYKSSGSIN